jgi:chromosome segregation ATPase
VSCFDVTPDFAARFEYQKGENPVKYLEAGFNRDQQSGEFFIEFDEQVHDTEVELSFQAQHAKGINVLTFPNDNGKSASDALLRVMAVQNKTGFKISRGKFPDSLKKSFETQKAAQDKILLEREFNEKTRAAEKISFEEFKSKMEEVCSEVQGLGHVQQGIKDDVLSIGNDVQAHAVKLEAIEGGVQAQTVDLVDIKQGVCNVIPDYQQEIKQLKEALAKKTAACDTIEGRLAHKTRIINQQDAYIANLEEEKQVWSKTKVELQDKYSLLQEEFNMFRTLRQMIDTLSSTLAEERAAKRPRA